MRVFTRLEEEVNLDANCEFGKEYDEFGLNLPGPATAQCVAHVATLEQNHNSGRLLSSLTSPVDRGSSVPLKHGEERIAFVEAHVFLRECITRGMEGKLPYKFEAFSTTDDLERELQISPVRLIILSCSGANDLDGGRGRSSIERLSAMAPKTPIVVLASRHDANLMQIALETGAKGYILTSMGFDLAIEAVRFVLAGGTYAPVDILAAAATARAAPVSADRPIMTAREMLVIGAIKQGKPNKVIAYELNMCESTVKVHVRHIMKKLGAKNRTAVAMRAGEMLVAPPMPAGRPNATALSRPALRRSAAD